MASTKSHQRNLKIRLGAVRRLAKEVAFYHREKSGLEAKLESDTAAAGSEEERYELRKTQELIDESAAVIVDTREKLLQACHELQELVEQVKVDVPELLVQPQEDAGEEGGAETELAVEVRLKLRYAAAVLAGFLDGVFPEDRERQLRVVVFGSSRCGPGDELYAMAKDLGRVLGRHNVHVVTGGYCGTMEAVSEGAVETGEAGRVVVEGVISQPTFPHRGNAGNSHLTVTTPSPNLQQRLALLTQDADLFVVLPGNTGTLTELMLVWNISVINPFSNKPRLRIAAFREPWQQVISAVQPLLGVSQEDVDLVEYVDSVEDVGALLDSLQADN